MTPDAEVSVYMNTVTIKLPPPGISSPVPSVFTPSPRRIKYADVEADRGAVQAWIRENALPADRISAPKGRGGRPPRYNHDEIEDKVLELMDDNNEFDTDGWCRARLEDEIKQFCMKRFGKKPANSTVEATISRGLDKWREKNR